MNYMRIFLLFCNYIQAEFFDTSLPFAFTLFFRYPFLLDAVLLFLRLNTFLLVFLLAKNKLTLDEATKEYKYDIMVNVNQLRSGLICIMSLTSLYFILV